MRGAIVLGLLLLAAITAFSLQNPEQVTVDFFWWGRTVSLALAMVAAAVAGALIVYAASLASHRGARVRLSRAQMRIRELEAERDARTGVEETQT